MCGFVLIVVSPVTLSPGLLFLESLVLVFLAEAPRALGL